MNNRKEATNKSIEKIARRKSIKSYFLGMLAIAIVTVIAGGMLFLLEGTIVNGGTIIGLLLLAFYMTMCPKIRQELEKDYLEEEREKLEQN